MTLEWPLGMILPWAVATISMVPKAAQRNAAANTAMIVQVTIRPTEHGREKLPGLPCGRRCASLSSAEHGVVPFSLILRRTDGHLGDGHPGAHVTWRNSPCAPGVPRVSHARQCVPCRAQDAMGCTHGRQTMGNEEHRASPAHLREIMLNNGFGLVVERTGGFVEDEDTRVADQRTRNRQALTLATGEGTAV